MEITSHTAQGVSIYLKNDIRMRKKTFDITMILLIAILFVTLSQFDLLEKSMKFMFIPILAFYFLGQFAERRFQ